MDQKRLALYKIDLKYVRDLSKADDNVMSVSPQAGKSTRPFIGIIVICNDKQYCVPFSSPKPKHNKMKNDTDFMKIMDGEKIIAVLNFNCMIPVSEKVVSKINISISRDDTPETIRYKKLISKQLSFCQKNQDLIVRKANKLYLMINSGKANNLLQKRCCDFKKLETILDKFTVKHSDN